MIPTDRPAAQVCSDPKRKGFAILRDKKLTPGTFLYTWHQVMEMLTTHVVVQPPFDTKDGVIIDVRPESRRFMIGHLRRLADLLEKGATPIRGGLSAANEYSLSGDIELAPLEEPQHHDEAMHKGDTK